MADPAERLAVLESQRAADAAEISSLRNNVHVAGQQIAVMRSMLNELDKVPNTLGQMAGELAGVQANLAALDARAREDSEKLDGVRQDIAGMRGRVIGGMVVAGAVPVLVAGLVWLLSKLP